MELKQNKKICTQDGKHHGDFYINEYSCIVNKFIAVVGM